MKIVNPMDNDITVQVPGGTKYTVLANDSISGVPAKHAEFWKGLHPWLVITPEATDVVEEVIEEIVEDIKEDVKEEVIEVEKKEEVIEEVKEEVIEDKKEEVKETIADKVKKVIKKGKK